MLKQVKFKNFKSFTKETVISLEATKSEILKYTNTYNNILKGVCFYGPNSSGKSNALEAISILPRLLFETDGITIAKLFSVYNEEGTMYFEYVFKNDSSDIVYYFEMNRLGQFVNEKLKLNGKKILTRTINNAESCLSVSDTVDENNLYLRNVWFNTGFNSFPVLKEWFMFLKNFTYFELGVETSKLMRFNPSLCEKSYLEDYIEKYDVKGINDFLEKYNFGYSLDFKKTSIQDLGIVPLKNKIKVVREGMPPIPLSCESHGDFVFLTLLPMVLKMVKTSGILVIDNYGEGLHNYLEELLIKYFYEHSSNTQLIFVSQSTNLLKTSLLRPDQVYSTEFNGRSTTLNRFSNEKPRELQNIEKMYLSGVFGGIPLYGKNVSGGE